MVFLINCSNLKVSGGLQVADSICGQLNRFGNHRFIVVLSPSLEKTKERIVDYENCEVYQYNIPNTFTSVVLGRDRFLDTLVAEKGVQAVLTVFGPSRWAPRVPHLCGFAMPALVIPESPFLSSLKFSHRLKWRIWCMIRKWAFGKCAKIYWTENAYISERVKNLYNNSTVYTVGNYYNQIFDESNKWKRNLTLPLFEGTTCLSVSSPIDHKNFKIIPDILRYLKKVKPEFKVRFVLTFTYEDSEMTVPDDVRESILFLGKVDVSEVPYLYEQADIMFMPSLLECFSATYPEAMRMEKPIVTTDLEFAKGLCGDAACYYSAIDAEAAAEAIYKVANDKEYARKLIANGVKKLATYDNYEQRADKLIGILEQIVK